MNRHEEVPALRNVFDEQHSAEQIERYHLIKAAQLVLRAEATRQGRLMVEFLQELGLLNDRDFEILEDVGRFDDRLVEAADMRHQLRFSPYYRELVRTYRPKLYAELMGPTADQRRLPARRV